MSQPFDQPTGKGYHGLMDQHPRTVTGLSGPKLLFSLFLRNLIISATAAVTVFVFQRKRILSGSGDGLYPFLCWASGSALLAALVLTLRGIVLARWNSLTWHGGRQIILTNRFRRESVTLDLKKVEARLGGSVFGMGRKGELIQDGKRYRLVMGGFSSAEWNAAENILVAIQLFKIKGSDPSEVSPPDLIV